MKNASKTFTTVSITREAAEALAIRAKKAGMSKQQFLSLLLLSPEKTQREDLVSIDKRIDGLAKLIRAIERDKLDPVLVNQQQTAAAIVAVNGYCRQSTEALQAIFKKGART